MREQLTKNAERSAVQTQSEGPISVASRSTLGQSSLSTQHDAPPEAPLQSNSLLARSFANLPIFPPSALPPSSPPRAGAIPLQARLTIGAVHDPHELEADRVADEVVRMPDTPTVQRVHTPAPAAQPPSTDSAREEPQQEDMEQQEELQAKSYAGGMGGAADDELESTLGRTQGGGFPLSDPFRDKMERAIGVDFSNVRIHTDEGAVQMSRQIHAQAFTHGSDIYFNAGKYDPSSSAGQHLLAHELTHVVQQGGAVRPKLIQLKPGDECGSDFVFSFRGRINAETEKKHRGVPRAYYSKLPTTGNDAGTIVKGTDNKALPLEAGTELDAGQLHNGLWRAVCIKVPGVEAAQILWVLNEYIDNPAAPPAEPAPQKEKKKEAEESAPPTSLWKALSEGVSIDLDMNGGLTSKELHVTLKSDNSTTVSVTFKHTQGTKTQTVKLKPTKIKVKDAHFHSMGSTDGIHPLELYLAGYSTEDDKKAVFNTIFIAPSGTPGQYSVMEGETFDPASAQAVDLGVPSTFTETGNKIIEQQGDFRKEGGTWRFDYRIGPNREIGASLFIIKDPENEDAILCYFHMAGTAPGKSSIQSSPSKTMRISLPVTFEELDIEKFGESNGSVTYRFLPPQYARGFKITYEMNPLEQGKVDAANATHGLNVYPINTNTGTPDSITPPAQAGFKQLGGEWKFGGERRTVENFRVESAKDAYSKLAQMEVPKNELSKLTGEMSLIVMTAVKEGIASKQLFEQWVELSFGVTVYGPQAAKGDETAKTWLAEKSDAFITTLLGEIGSTGTTTNVSASGVGPAGGPITTSSANKYTGASRVETKYVGPLKVEPTVSEKKPFEEVRTLLGSGKYDEALAQLRGSYYLWVEDQLLNNSNADKDTKEKLKSYGYQLSYRRQLKDTMGKAAHPLQKVKALYYPDMTNITGENKYQHKYVGADKIVSIPLDLYYEDTGTEWVLYNFTTLAEPGKVNEFKRTRAKADGEFAPPQEMFDLLTKDEGIGTGYIHYQTEIGEGGMVRVEHPWTVGGVLLGAAAVIGLIALALTGVGLLFEGAAIGGISAAGAATVLGDIAVITAVAGGSIKLATDISEGAPISAGQVAGLALDVATAVVPVVRSLRTVASLRRYKNAFILLDTAANAQWATKLELAANTTAMIVATEKGVEELLTLSKALEEGRIDDATFYWAVARNVGLGVINVVLLKAGYENLQGRTIGNTTIDEVVQKGLQRNLLEAKPGAMYSRENLESGIEIMQNSSSVYRSMVLESLANESKLEQAIDVLCYLGAKGRGGLDDVVILDGKVRRAVDVLVEGKFMGKTLAIPQGFTGSKGEALDTTPRDFAAFSKSVADGVHAVPGLENAEVRLQGSAAMGIARSKKPETPTETPAPTPAEKPAEGQAAPAAPGKTWDLDLAIMMDPAAYRQKLVSIFNGKVKFADKKNETLGKKGAIDLDKLSPEDLLAEARKMNAEDVSRKIIREEAKAKEVDPVYPTKVYNSEAYTFANALLTGKANMSSEYFPEIAALQQKLKADFKLPGLDLSVIAKDSGFDSTPFITLK